MAATAGKTNSRRRKEQKVNSGVHKTPFLRTRAKFLHRNISLLYYEIWNIIDE